MAAPVGWVGSGSRRVNLPSVTVATVPQRAMHRLQYPCTCRTFGISADMHKLPRGNEYGVGRTWLPYRVNRQVNIKLPPSDYLRKLSFHTVFLDQERIMTRDRANCEIGRDHRPKWIYVTKRFQSQKSSQFYSEWRAKIHDILRHCMMRLRLGSATPLDTRSIAQAARHSAPC